MISHITLIQYNPFLQYQIYQYNKSPFSEQQFDCEDGVEPGSRFCLALILSSLIHFVFCHRSLIIYLWEEEKIDIVRKTIR